MKKHILAVLFLAVAMIGNGCILESKVCGMEGAGHLSTPEFGTKNGTCVEIRYCTDSEGRLHGRFIIGEAQKSWVQLYPSSHNHKTIHEEVFVNGQRRALVVTSSRAAEIIREYKINGYPVE